MDDCNYAIGLRDNMDVRPMNVLPTQEESELIFLLIELYAGDAEFMREDLEARLNGGVNIYVLGPNPQKDLDMLNGLCEYARKYNMSLGEFHPTID